MGHSFMKPSKRNAATKKPVNIPTRNANPTGQAGAKNSTGRGPKGNSAKTSTRFNRAALYRAKGEKII